MKRVKKDIGRTDAHCEPAKGTCQQNKTYTQKEGDFFESGQMPQQGHRTDLDDIRVEALKTEGDDELQLLQTGRIRNLQGLIFFQRVRDLAMEAQAKTTTAPTVHWSWGPSGTGKTHLAMEEASLGGTRRYHSKTGMSKWYPDSNAPTYVIWDDFRANYRDLEFSFVLTLLGIGRTYVEAKGRSRPWTAKEIWITSIKSPHDCVPDGEDPHQLLRRIKTIRHLTEPRAEGWAGTHTAIPLAATTSALTAARLTPMPPPPAPPTKSRRL